MKWFQFILSHSIFIAVCGAALAFQTTHLLRLDANVYIYGFIFFATLCSYNFYWIISKTSFSDKKNLKAICANVATNMIIFFIAGLGLLFCLFKSALPLNYVITAVVLTILYAIPLLPFKALHFTRKAGFIKTVLLSFTWAYVTAFIPLQKTYLLLNEADLFVISRRFLFMLMLCIIFDNRDKNVDKMRGLHSLATDLGPILLTILIYGIFAILFITNFLFQDYGITFQQSIALQISTVALLGVYLLSAKKRSYMFYYFVVDGMMLFSALATYIASI
jgi:hypothetical protein